MGLKLLREGTALTAFLSGDLDHHSAACIRAEIDRSVRCAETDRLTLDFSDVTFMDSSGIGLVMGRYKLLSEIGGICEIANPPQYIKKVLKISGADRLCRIISRENSAADKTSHGGNES